MAPTAVTQFESAAAIYCVQTAGLGRPLCQPWRSAPQREPIAEGVAGRKRKQPDITRGRGLGALLPFAGRAGGLLLGRVLAVAKEEAPLAAPDRPDRILVAAGHDELGGGADDK